MTFYTRKHNQATASACQVPSWDKEYDVIVAGAGSGGIYAALAAAREGKRVLLLEKSRWCGGQHIQGLVNGYYYGYREGLFRRTDRKAKENTADVFYDVAAEGKRIIVAEELKAAGVDVLTQSMSVGVYAEGKTVKGIRALTEHRQKDFGCRMLIDATSDGHVLRLLPVELKMGRGWDGEPQPFSSVRSVYLDRMKYDGGLSVTVGKMGKRYGLFHEYRDNGYVNQYDAEDLTRGILRAHASHLEFIGQYTRFLYLAPIIGLREGVLYEGEEYLTLEQVLRGTDMPENALFYCFSDIDKHGTGTAFDDEIYQNWFVCSNMSTCTVYIPIPAGALVPKGWKGLATAGRCISTDTYANSAIRMNTDCFRIGEASGTLAALAADFDADPMAVPLELLKAKLTDYGFYEEKHNRAPSFWTPAMGDDRRHVSWMTGEAELKAALSTDCPAVALWSCYMAGKEKLGDTVYAMTQSTDEMLKRNAGIALGMMHDARAIPILQEIIRNREPFYFMDCRRTNQMRSVIAICLAGQMGAEAVADELLTMLKPEEFDREMYHVLLEPEYKRTIVKEQNSVYYQHFSHAVAALTKIALANPGRREEIKAALHEALDDSAYIRRITNTPQHNAFHHAAANCLRYVEKMLG